MKQETLNLIANIDENTIILPKSEGGVYEMYQMDSIADLRKASRNFMRTEKILESLDAKTSAASELVAGIVTEARIKEISKALDPIQATELVAGIVKISTSSQIEAGTDNSTAVSPAKLLSLFSGNTTLGKSGRIKFPGGLIVQWGYIPDQNVTTTTYFPVAYSVECTGVFAQRVQGTIETATGTVSANPGATGEATNVFETTKSYFNLDSVYAATDKSAVFWIAIGY